MKELNPLVLALNDIDTRYIVEPKRKKRPIMLLVAVAAAVALTGFVGASDSFVPDVRYTYSDGSTFYYDLPVFDITIPEQYPNNFKPGESCVYRMTGMLPSELFAQFGLTPLTSDSFNEVFEFEPVDQGTYTDYGQPSFHYNWLGVDFRYYLYDKKIQRLVIINAFYCTSDEYSERIKDNQTIDYPVEILELKDGSKCRVSSYGSTFTYDGVEYHIGLYDRIDEADAGFEMEKQIIKDLGIL